ncbi:MAG: FIST C-terminal domain-containing protein [Anaerolineae bacterium]|nr:FIST C-terminal domain-containing protein [Anaerolineae bacterium]
MEIASSFSTTVNTVEALKDAYAVLVEKLGSAPTWMTVHGTYHHAGETVTATLQALAPGVPFQGGSSCLGVMTEVGFHSEEGVGLGILGIRDPEGVYGLGCAELTLDSRESGREAIKRALQNAGKNTPPRVVWITCAPGDEEAILAGIEDGLAGAHVPIIGGSSADNTVEGKWYQLTNGQVLRHGVVVTAMYPSKPIRYAFDSSYTPTAHTGIITKASGRTVYKIDHRPAAEVYNEWTNGVIAEYMDGGNILAPTTLYPLGRAAMWTRGETLYQLSHPEAVLENRALSLFTKVEVGEEIVLMESSAQDLVQRVDRVTSKALAGIPAPDQQVAGALVIYCAGCMLAVTDRMQEVAKQFCEALAGQPFLGLFTFGEQGRALLGENCHANLMMSIIVFEK